MNPTIHIEKLYLETIDLLKELIAIPSFSKEEEGSAAVIENYFLLRNIKTERNKNNVWVLNKYFDKSKPTILLHSHHDTVKPNVGYTRSPFLPVVEGDKLYGLGSNDAGGALVALIATFMAFYDYSGLNYNIIFAATAEEEISGKNGIVSVLPRLPQIDFAIVGEPTLMQMAIAEKGLMVIDCIAKGVAGHAARNEGDNAIYKALKDIEWIKNFQFPKISETLGPVKMTVSIINAGKQHNVVPDECTYTIDVRTTDAYTNEETLEIIKQHITSEARPRSMRLQPSFISNNHVLAQAANKLGVKTFGSPTLSDQALIKVPSVKIGPGDSARSHSADEYINLSEIKSGIEGYVKLIGELVFVNPNF
ncbi:MAG: M20 family metallo-hydrolase [Bacteroidia bacterium]|nr:M20 family metallo-hydrolase [Bacteroidia bacterium]